VLLLSRAAGACRGVLCGPGLLFAGTQPWSSRQTSQGDEERRPLPMNMPVIYIPGSLPRARVSVATAVRACRGVPWTWAGACRHPAMEQPTDQTACRHNIACGRLAVWPRNVYVLT
jgi:hypothetical protein